MVYLSQGGIPALGQGRRAAVLELEAKFTVPDEQTFQQLLAASNLGAYRLGQSTLARVHDRYLDTPEGALHQGGYALRLRREDGRHLASVKGLGDASGAVHHREEYEVELPGPLPPQEWPPGSPRDLVLGLIQDRPLIPLFELEQDRHQRSVTSQGRQVAEFSLDRVRVRQDDAVAATYLELEVELLADGQRRDLEEILAELQKRAGVVPQPQSKFERGLALFGLDPTAAGKGARPEVAEPARAVDEGSELAPATKGPEEPLIVADDSMSEAGRKTLRFQYQKMLYHEPGTRLGEDIEALHDMRVATRRMRAAWRVFGDYFEPKAVAPFLKGLKRTGRALGPVRDLDVFREKVRAYAATLPEAEQGRLDGLLGVLDARREAARARMIVYLDTEKYARFVARFGQFLETPGMGSLEVGPGDGEPRPHRVRHVAPMAIYERLAAVRSYDEWVTIPDPPLERLHALRIACKRLRYTLEFFEQVLGPDARVGIKEVVAVQDHLGELQDAVVASGILGDLLSRGTWAEETESAPGPGAMSPEAREGVEAYLAAKESELLQLMETFPEAWQPLNTLEFSRLVAEAVAVL
jgi:CHAD domain-containing protein